MELNRRDFLKGALATGIVATGAGLAGCAPAASDAKVEEAASSFPEGLQASDFEESPVIVEPITDIAEEKTFDVVVVGAGTGGVPAALSALEEGATVAVLQKESKPIAQGGTCSGVLLDQSDEQGVMNYLQGYLEDCRWRADRKLAETYCKYSGEAIRWTQVRTAEAGFPPYTVRPTAVTEYEDGSKCARRSIMFGPKPYNNGTMVEHLAELAASKGVEFFYSTPGVQLVTDESGTVTGVIGKSGSSYIKFNATKGVILSTGDYQNNQSLVERYCPDVKEFDRKQSNKTGDGILMSMAVGAGFVPVGHSHMMHDFDSGPMFDEPFLFVNEDGERFMNEDCVFEEVNCVLRNQPKPGWYSQIFDDDYVEQVTEWGGKPTDKEKIQVYMPDVKMDRSAESGANTFDGFLKTIATYSNNNKVYTYNYETDAMNTPANSVAMFDDLWKNADERLKDLKAEGQRGLLRFVGTLQRLREAPRQHEHGRCLHRLYQRPSKPAVSRHSRRGSAHLVLPGQTEFFVARTQVVLHPDRPPQPGAGRQYGRLPRQRNPHVVQPRRNGEPPARRLHGRLRRARRRTGRIRIAHLTMSGTTPYARPLKPAGGIEAVWLIPASDIVSATYGDGCCTGLTLRAGASADQWLILEQSSSFREENLNPDGPPRFRHTLTLVADPEEIRDRLGERQLARLATEGTVARIETASGVFLLAGRSEKFGAEQPLRLTEIRYESQTKFAARPVLVLTLAGEDTAPAPPIREQ